MRQRVLVWLTAPPVRRDLRREGYHIIRFPRLAAAALAARPRSVTRSSLKNPAAGLLALYAKHARVAVLEVPCRTVDDLRLIHGYLVEPAFRLGCTLLIHAERDLDRLPSREFIDPEWNCPWTLERLRHLAARYAIPTEVPGPAPSPRWYRPAWLLSRGRDTRPRPAARLDPEQNAAVCAGDGVVQVIAPAGSGKTTVLIERVRELRRRGTPADRILCSTFNRAACREIAARLAGGGLDGVCVRSFHGLGLHILRREGRLRERIGTLEPARWQELATQAAAAEPDCGPFDAAAAQDAVSRFKLALMIPPAVALERATAAGPRQRAAARAYALYQQHLQRERRFDFDDLIAESLALLQDDARARERWQSRFERVLVDEYQDIEPAQALLIGLLAAPHDSLFCVGDEDQCIYAWRRAAVQRVIDLDQTYPSLERFPLVRNYRCGRAITHASRRLIRHNRCRFRKPLHAGVRQPGRIVVWPQREPTRGAACVAGLLQGAVPGEVAVLARTGNLLRAVAAACGDGPRPDGRADSVELTTVHGAKGREWDRVILFGADQGQFPLARTLRRDRPDEGGLEDERRLFYVAMTRARVRLDIVCNARRPSQFLREAGIRVG
ncbi:MAG: ATP-dependent helicase [Candidatus Krumholzibacteriia bacterium]